MRNAYAMSMLMGDGLNQGENSQSTNNTDNDQSPKVAKEEDRMQALHNFASISTRVPDAKHSKSRQKKILSKLQEELKSENQLLEQQIALAE